ncbi:hypothetical protein G7054_g78 [Neopestalotiopsis clavispora]|nr:hypothetical protein G7054_g78 [Neopestalotiopsis clavispora]
MLGKRSRDVESPLDSSAEGTKRREKGRLAQRVFRQKQIDTIRILKAENQKFRDAIAAISAAAIVDQTALTHAIKDAQTLAAPGQESKAAKRVKPNTVSNEKGASTTVTAPAVSEYQSYNYGTRPADYWSHQSDFTVSNPFSSPSNDLALTISGAPEEIIPYLGTEAYSVAGQIHWIAMAYGYSAAKALSEAKPSLVLNEYAAQAFGKVLKFTTVDNILCVLRGRLMYRKQGFMAGDEDLMGSYNPWLAKALMMTIVQNCAPLERHMLFTAFDVADCLRWELGAARFAKLEAALAGTATHSWVSVTRELVRELAFRAVCYGEGPRWRVEHVVDAARRWAIGTSLLPQ